MAGVQTDTKALCYHSTRGPFYVYGGLVCNSLMADSWSDRTPLHDAAYQGRLLNLRALLSQGFDVDILTMDRVSPLHEACLGGHYACARFLVENGANVEAVSTDGATPLFNSCSSGSAACVSLILLYTSATHTTNPLVSPIHEATKRGHRECLEVLMAHGADFDRELPGVGTPLFSACLAQASDCVQRLLHSGADVRKGCRQETPLHAAVRGGGANVVDLLIDYGADGSCRNSHGHTPLDLAAPNGPVRTTLLKRGPLSLSQLCRVSIRRSLGHRRLHRVSQLFLPDSVQAFLLYQ
ncbi:ankyrin repeat and SOCS box protein 11 [Aplochiton taeniatus]